MRARHVAHLAYAIVLCHCGGDSGDDDGYSDGGIIPPDGDTTEHDGGGTTGADPGDDDEGGSNDDDGDDGGAFVVKDDAGTGDAGTYSRCNFGAPGNECPPGEMCLGIMNPGPSACAATCAASTECPPPPEGTATPRCIADTNGDMMGDHCGLGCNPAGNDCPSGMTCSSVAGAPEGGLCLWA